MCYTLRCVVTMSRHHAKKQKIQTEMREQMCTIHSTSTPEVLNERMLTMETEL